MTISLVASEALILVWSGTGFALIRTSQTSISLNNEVISNVFYGDTDVDDIVMFVT